ncbi:MAG: Uma2 family endonuclease [Planctomycetes bacterium]|nr:Uma2 family endonuclease [Planctomycetota bacterium]
MSSTTTQIAPTPPDEQRFVFHDLSWERYEQLLRSLGDRRLRHTYVEGALEIVSPSMHHEWLKSVLGDLVAASCRLLGLPRKSIGSTTMKKKTWQRALEPDEGFYIGQQSVTIMRTRRTFNPDRDPPPDLIVEIDITSSSDDRMEFYRRLGVGEVWRYVDETVRFHALMKNARYRKINKSRLFPFLSAVDITRLLAKRDTMDDTQIELEFAAWAATQIARDAKGHRK